MPPTLDAAASALRDLAGRTGASLVVVFGSVARGGVRPDSDVDVAIEGLGWWEGLALGGEIGRVLGREPHVVDLGAASDRLRYEVARDGVLLHAHEPTTWPRFQASSAVRWLDLAPLVEICARGARERLRREAGLG